MQAESYIQSNAGGGMSFVGKPAVDLYAATVVRSGLKLHKATGMQPNRAYTIGAMLAFASRTTGQPLRKGKAKHDEAITDLTTWIEAQSTTIERR